VVYKGFLRYVKAIFKQNLPSNSIPAIQTNRIKKRKLKILPTEKSSPQILVLFSIRIKKKSKQRYLKFILASDSFVRAQCLLQWVVCSPQPLLAPPVTVFTKS